MQIHAEHDIMKTSKGFFKKYTSHFIWKGCVRERELETEQNCNILTPTLMAIRISFPLSRAAQPEAWGPTLLSAGFLFRILSPTCLQTGLQTNWLPVFTELYNSYMIVQLPTQNLPITGHRDVPLPLSLEWHVWLSSSGNNCHAVHRSLSSGASIGILPCLILKAKLTHANGICTSAVFGMACLAESKVNIQQIVKNISISSYSV